MGMFDEIIVKQELPLPKELKTLNIDWNNHRFQTKDFDNCLLEYILTEEGRLVEHVIEREYVYYTDEEKKSKKLKPWDLWKDVIEKDVRYEDVNYHGVFAFYTYEDFDENYDFWVDLKAYFSYGKLDKIELVDYKKEPSRKISNKRFDEERKRAERHPWNIFKRFASYFGWRWFWRNASSLCRQASDICSSAQMFIFKYLL